VPAKELLMIEFAHSIYMSDSQFESPLRRENATYASYPPRSNSVPLRVAK
jgi:hypothetical protein